jgi:hypothetical protein
LNVSITTGAAGAYYTFPTVASFRGAVVPLNLSISTSASSSAAVLVLQ